MKNAKKEKREKLLILVNFVNCLVISLKLVRGMSQNIAKDDFQIEKKLNNAKLAFFKFLRKLAKS